MRPPRRHRFAMALLTIGALVLAGCTTPDPASTDTAVPVVSSDIELPSPVRVGITFDQPLFSVPTASGMVGFDADIARQVVARLGGDPDDIEFIETVFENRAPFLIQDQVDIVVATFTINDERDELVDFAGPYLVAGGDILVPKGNPLGIESIRHLNTPDITTCTADDTTTLVALAQEAPDADIITYSSMSPCTDALAAGRVDAVASDNSILAGLAAYPRLEGLRAGDALSDPDFELVGNPFTVEPYGIGVPEGSNELRCAINQALQAMFDDGTWAELYDEWIGQVIPGRSEPPEINNQGC